LFIIGKFGFLLGGGLLVLFFFVLNNNPTRLAKLNGTELKLKEERF